MPDKRDHRYFFLHVMKTGGVTFSEHIFANFRRREIYPPFGHPDPFTATTSIPFLLGYPEGKKAKTQIFHGHFPYAVTEELGIDDLVTMAFLREPVARTISYLKYAIRSQERHHGKTLEEVYDDPLDHSAAIKDHQTKIFSLGPDDKFEAYIDCITVDEGRLEIAKENLRKLDVLGLTERYDDFLHTLEVDYGWEVTEIEPQNISFEEHYVISDELIARIIADNAIDIAFYEYGVELWSERNPDLEPPPLRWRAREGE